MNPTLRYYSKPDCPLCDKSRQVAVQLAEAFGLRLEEIDIRSERGLEARYGERIPVLTVDEQELGWGRLSRRAIERKLTEHLGRI